MEIIFEAASGSAKSIFTIAVFVIPLMIIMQVLKDYNVLDRIADMLSPLTDFFGMSKSASFPLLIGLTFGLSYGAGVIVQSSEEGSLTKKDIFLMVVFLINCHAIFEDTLVFVALGANGWVLLSARVAVAAFLTYFISKRMKISNEMEIVKAANGK